MTCTTCECFPPLLFFIFKSNCVIYRSGNVALCHWPVVFLTTEQKKCTNPGRAAPTPEHRGADSQMRAKPLRNNGTCLRFYTSQEEEPEKLLPYVKARFSFQTFSNCNLSRGGNIQHFPKQKVGNKSDIFQGPF